MGHNSDACVTIVLSEIAKVSGLVLRMLSRLIRRPSSEIFEDLVQKAFLRLERYPDKKRRDAGELTVANVWACCRETVQQALFLRALEHVTPRAPGANTTIARGGVKTGTSPANKKESVPTDAKNLLHFRGPSTHYRYSLIETTFVSINDIGFRMRRWGSELKMEMIFRRVGDDSHREGRSACHGSKGRVAHRCIRAQRLEAARF